MIMLLEKFRSVARYGVAVFLAAVSCFSAFAEIDCRAGEPYLRDGQWYVTVICTGDFSSSAEVPVEDPSSGGGGGTNVCTNCTAMTVQQCEQHKTNVLEYASITQASFDRALMDLGNARNDLSLVRSQIEGLKQEGDNFVSYPSNSDIPGSATASKVDFILNGPTGPYISTGSTSSPSISTVRGGNNSIYSYYNEAVKPALTSAESYVNKVASEIDFAIDNITSAFVDLDSLITYVQNDIVCSVCQSSGGSGGGGSGGGGSGDDDDDDGGGGSGGCPCAEVLNHILQVLMDMQQDLKTIKTKINRWDSIIDQINANIASIASDVYKIRRTTDLMDDFFRDDTELNFAKLIEHTLTLSNSVFSGSLSLPPNLYWTEYTNATQFLDAQGDNFDWAEKGSTISTATGQWRIDFGEYEQLNWFQRIEYLLGSIAGIFNPTSGVSDVDFSQEDKANQDLVKDQLSSDTFDLDSQVTPVRTLISKVNSAKSKLNPFSDIFSTPSVQKVTILPNVSLGSQSDFNRLISDQEVPSIQIDLTRTGDGSFNINSLVGLAHSLTTFLWFVLLLLVNFICFLWFFRSLVRIFEWYHKITLSWAHSLLNGSAS